MKSAHTILSCYTPFFTMILVAVSENTKASNEATVCREQTEILRRLAEKELDAAERSATALRGVRAAHMARRFAVAWADEYLMTREWGGRKYWMAHPLQGDWGEGRNAGDVFFQDLQALVPSSDDESAVAEVALRCFALGFAGRFYGQPETLAQLHKSTGERFYFRTQASVFPPPLKDIPRRMKTCWYMTCVLLFLVVGFWFLQEHLLYEKGQKLLPFYMTEQHPTENETAFLRSLNILGEGVL